jgi:competence ComEA-like helix-hairpin-helix protein
MGFKDYFYFTKTERNGIIVLIFLILIILAYPFVKRNFTKPETIDFTELNNQIKQYEQFLSEYEKAKESFEHNKNLAKQENQETVIELKPEIFNPNELSLDEYVELGLTQAMARNIINYRNAGGQFRYREDFKRIYSITDDIYYQLESYIDLPVKPEPGSYTKPSADKDIPLQDSVQQFNNERTPGWADILIDINQADTTEWQKIRGIGPVFSRRITAYRDLLGGFYSTDQLMEVFGMDSARFEQIADHIFVDESELTQININDADFVKLVRHPYLNRNQVNSIIRMREQHGLYKDIDELKKSELINDSVFQKIAPYLTVSNKAEIK